MKQIATTTAVAPNSNVVGQGFQRDTLCANPSNIEGPTKMAKDRNSFVRMMYGLGLGTIATFFVFNERSEKATFKVSELMSVFFNNILFSKRFRSVFFISLMTTGILRFFSNLRNRLH